MRSNFQDVIHNDSDSENDVFSAFHMSFANKDVEMQKFSYECLIQMKCCTLCQVVLSAEEARILKTKLRSPEADCGAIYFSENQGQS